MKTEIGKIKSIEKYPDKNSLMINFNSVGPATVSMGYDEICVDESVITNSKGRQITIKNTNAGKIVTVHINDTLILDRQEP